MLEVAPTKKSPAVSIIIATRNRPQLLRRAIESAFTAAVDVEVVVVDDASVDETAAVCKSIPQIVYVRLEQNLGVAGARNRGILASNAPFISFLDDDDVRLPGSLDRQLELFDSTQQLALVYGQVIPVDNELKQTGPVYPFTQHSGDAFVTLLSQNFIPCGSAVFRRSSLDKVGLLDEKIPGIDDWDLWIRLAAQFEIGSIDEPVLKWRQSNPGSEQGSSAADEMVAKAVRQFSRRWLPIKNESAEFRRSISKQFLTNMAAHLIWETVRAFRVRSYRQALKNALALRNVGLFAVLRVVRRHFSSLGKIDTLMQATNCSYSKAWSDTKL